MGQVKIKFWIFIVIFTASLFVAGCHPADIRLNMSDHRRRTKLKHEFKVDRNSPEYYKALEAWHYWSYRADEIKRQKAKIRESQQPQQQADKNSNLKPQTSNLKQQGGENNEFALRKAQ